ncbi:MAG: hypothetical protein U9P42_08400, partial [Candidatus Fermentibacteria bacterium]|nr:hypothetical protein [Candidatus Fermentibacteria bacterium]
PSGRILAVLYARTGEPIDSVRQMLDSPQGMVLQSGLSREKAETLSAELPNDGSVQIHLQRDEVVFVPVLMGYRPGCRGRLRIAMQKLSRLPTEEVIRFLARVPIALKLDADRAAAESIKRILERAGGIVEIRSPGDLIGVSSKKDHGDSSTKTVVFAEEAEATPVVEPYSDNQPDRDSLSSDTRREKPAEEPKTVSAYNSIPPPVLQIVPPVVAERNAEGSDDTCPYAISFTVPAAAIPAVIHLGQNITVPPEQPLKTVMVYLFPVASRDSEQVQTVLCETLDLSKERAQKFISKAPVAITGFSQRIDALVSISELTDLGVPVSLVPGTTSNPEPSPGRSLLGWLNGHGRTS